MISQIINLSNHKSFNHYKKKYDFQILPNRGLFGIELRNVSSELLESGLKRIPNLFLQNKYLFIIGSFNEIINIASEAALNQNLKSEIMRAIEKYNKSESIAYKIDHRTFNFKNAYVMAILNVTPDSFSDIGMFKDHDKAIDYAQEMIELGADIIDVGGESSRPGSEAVDVQEEINRVIPLIIKIKERKSEAIISIDTTKAAVAREALLNGASIVNDISGGSFEPNVFNIVKEFDAAMIIMHMKGTPKTMQENPTYDDVVSEVYDFLFHQTEIARKQGIDKIIVDPGIGFGKRTEDNLNLIERLEDFKSLGYPILIGLSRKSFIGKILNLPVEERDNSTNSLNTLAMCKGARVIRTHNAKQAIETCNLFNAIVNN